MQDEAGRDRTQSDHSSDREVGTGKKDQAGNAEGVEHPRRALLEDREDIGQREQVAGALQRRDDDTDDEEYDDRYIETICKEERGRTEVRLVVHPLHLHILAEVRLSVPQLPVLLDMIDVSLVLRGLAVVDLPLEAALRIEESALRLILCNGKLALQDLGISGSETAADLLLALLTSGLDLIHLTCVVRLGSSDALVFLCIYSSLDLLRDLVDVFHRLFRKLLDFCFIGCSCGFRLLKLRLLLLKLCSLLALIDKLVLLQSRDIDLYIRYLCLAILPQLPEALRILLDTLVVLDGSDFHSIVISHCS